MEMEDYDIIGDKYLPKERIGKGAYGIVLRAKDMLTKNVVALKCIRFNMDEQAVTVSTIREISLLQELQHPNIVHLLDVVKQEFCTTLVFEYLDSDLMNYLRSHTLNLPTIKSYMYQIFKAVDFIHERKIIHRDLKTSNLLVNNKGQIKVADFGLARHIGIPDRSLSTEVVTLWYRSPDLILGSREYTTAIDMWSLGCVFGELALKRPLFQGSNSRAQLDKIFQVLGTPPDDIWQSFLALPNGRNWEFKNSNGVGLEQVVAPLGDVGIELLTQLLQYDPDKRISAQNALKHKFFEDVCLP